MPRKFALNPVKPSDEKSLKTLVENRRVFTLESCELNLFETFVQSEKVPLTFDDFVVTSMITGKKVMQLNDSKKFDYLPGETVLVPALKTMNIDFPEAQKDNPTQCIALTLEKHKIDQVIQRLNEEYPKPSDENYWKFNFGEYHFQNNFELAANINKIISVCTSANTEKDILADLAIKELVVRIIQSQNLCKVNEDPVVFNQGSPLSYVLNYIRINIGQQFHIQELSSRACMSIPTFYRTFKNMFGLSPLEYILHEKIKHAKAMLSNPSVSITEISYELGFSSLNYFDRQFKRIEGITPKQYRKILVKTGN